MATASSLMELMRDREPVSSEHLREIIIDHVLWAVEESADAYADQTLLVHALMRAHYRALAMEAEHAADENEQADVPLVKGPDAEQLMRQAFLRGFLTSLPGHRIDEVFWWPDEVVEYRAHRHYEPGLMRALGYALGCYEGRRSRAIYEYFARERAQEYTP